MFNILAALERLLVIRPLWFVYTCLTRLAWEQKHQSEDKSDFQTKGFMSDKLPDEFIEPLIRSLPDTRFSDLNPTDTNSHYVSNAYLANYERDLNAKHRFYALTPTQLEQVHRITQHLEPMIEKGLRSAFRIVNIHCWCTTPIPAKAVGLTEWHKDWMARGINKLMVYLTPVDEEWGSTQIRLRDGSETVLRGPRGTWLFFKISELWHRLYVPKTKTRIVLQITLAPAFKTDTRPVMTSSNAQYPKLPWYTSAQD